MLYKVKGIKDLFEESGLFDKNYYYNFETIRNVSDEYFDNFEKALKAHVDYEKLKNNFIIDRKSRVMIHIHEKILLSEIEDLSDEEKFFYPLCNRSEINRIFNPKNSSDIFLKYRAEKVIDFQRLHRVVDRIRRKQGCNWSFSKFFDSDQFNAYLDSLPLQEKNKSASIPHGTIHSNEANGSCIPTPFGNIVTVSHALRRFLNFMNLFHFGKQMGFEQKEEFPSFLIAVRTMLGTESIDFEIDTRGDIPTHINDQIEVLTDWQMMFVIGHEYAHHYLDHLTGKKTFRAEMINGTEVKYYNHNQIDELEADYYSITKPIISDDQRNLLANSAFQFFQWIDLYQTVREYMFPSSSVVGSHPNPIDRIFELRNRLDTKYGYLIEELHEQLNYYSDFKKFLINEFLPFNVEKLEKYGAIYLDTYKTEYIHDRLL